MSDKHAPQTRVTFSGHLTDDVELRFAEDGDPVANFTLVNTPTRYDQAKGERVPKEPIYMRCSIWREQALLLPAAARRGDRLLVTGSLRPSTVEVRGQKRTIVELLCNEVAVSLKAAA